MFNRARVPMLRMHLQREFMQIWKQIIASDGLGAHTIWIDRAKTMACCGKITLGGHISTPPYNEILQMIGVGWLTWMDEWIIKTVERIIEKKSCGDTQEQVPRKAQNMDEVKVGMIEAWSSDVIAKDNSDTDSDGEFIPYPDDDDDDDDEEVYSDDDEIYSVDADAVD
ncbi:hypothetical protein G6011_00865 [Alternaria panax]|uniref:Uncharacterized protein n=1 Tax=Alternaria panax TaxID=48097 RepID=A0AAD4NVF5_9PLEO|nr:hypothetical protein G6011_00865 [Alternaria panax]